MPTSSAVLQQALFASNIIGDDPAILATLIVDVFDNKGSLVPCRALLDSGATTNFVSERFVQTLDLVRCKDFKRIGGIGCSNETSKGTCHIKITSRYGDYPAFEISANILQKITDVQPPLPIDTSGFNLPTGTHLADPFFNKPQQIDLLIGGGLFWHILLPGRIEADLGSLLAQETKFGWIITGPLMNKNKIFSALVNTEIQNSESSTKKLCELVERFWKVDDINSLDNKLSLRDQECETHYSMHTCRDKDGTYIVSFPFFKSPDALGDSLRVAMRRFLNLEKRLNKQPEIKKMYANFINEYKELNHLEILNEFDPSKRHYFLPHHCVTKMSSTSTKLRVVFDGSCKSSSGISLNDIIHSGPKLQDDLFVILLRFRMYRYVLTGDIQKMYRQVRMNEADRNFQLILWRSTENDEIQILRLCTVTYGTASGAYLAIKTLYRLADDEQYNFPIGASVLRRNFYVDDMMVGANTIIELTEIRRQITSLLQRGGFTLSKFCSNNDDILAAIDIQHHEKFLRIDDQEVVKTLGLIWQPDLDVFRYTYQSSDTSPEITKRVVLSEMASLFDPLGLVCPVITLAKIFYQELWKCKLDWDTPLEFSLNQKWKKFRSQLGSLRQIAIPRFVMFKSEFKSVEIHAFSDASEKAYGSCVYLRCLHQDKTISCRLLCAKSRVAPTKTLSIARLELLAAKLMTDLVSRLKEDVLKDICINTEYYWSDSMITLCWIRAEPHHWNVFVANRVSKIQKATKEGIWRHIPGELNPADLISRGMLPTEIASSTIWFNGPEYLNREPQFWPPEQIIPTPTDDIEEKRTMKFALVARVVDDLTDSMHFSVNFRGIRRVFAYVHRFIKHAKSPVVQKEERRKMVEKMQMKDFDIYSLIQYPLAFEEEESERPFLRNIQKAAFTQEYQLLHQDRVVDKSSRLKCLAPFLDDFGLLRVGGRLKKANISFNSKHQILLPKDHHFTRSLIHYVHHFRTFHGGPHIVLTSIRAKYWPISGLVLTRSILHECIWCFRMRPKFLRQIMGGLPPERVDFTNTQPFSVSGVDFAGPLNVRHHIRCRVQKKVYIALFICFTTKAVHLELVVDLSTEAFIRALKRFIADRGKITKIYSDNATNFQGTANQLKEVKRMLLEGKDGIKAACNQSFIEWSFIPPRSPNFGGLWEASIKIAKRLVRNIIGNTEVTIDELHTVVRQVAAIINSRPITPISADPNDLEPLTPGHFLYGGPPSSLPEITINDTSINRVKLFQQVNWINQQFWTRFRKEYLSSMQPRTKWMIKTKNIQVGTMVLLKDDALPPLNWSIGRVIEVNPDKDGNVRILKIKTASGVYDRSICGIAVLPIEETNFDG